MRSLEHRQEREQAGQFFVEGIRIVGEAVQMEAEVETIVYAPGLLRSQFAFDLVQAQQEQGVPCLEVTPEVFKSLSAKDGPQGMAAVVKQRWETLERVRLADELCWVALDEVQDPGNIGTILRTSDAVGSAGLILLGNSADPYDPAALRASMGAVFSQRLVKASFAEFVYWKQGYTVIGTSGASPTSYRSVTYPRPAVLLMGSERQGLSQEQRAVCDVVVSIPMVGRSDSLNLAVATGVMLYELFHQSAASTHTKLV